MFRAIIVLLILLWGISKVFANPYVGVYLWTWVSLMNPHKLTWGLLNHQPFAQIIAVVTAIGLMTGKQLKLKIGSPQTTVLLIFILWVCFTTLFAVNPKGALEELDRFLKIQIFILLSLALISDKKILDGFIWVIALSIGFFGVKGGIFTILTGGSARVWGPEGSFIAGNNEVALAMLMVLPLMRYLQLQATNTWIRRGLVTAMLLTAIAILGTQSRGALLGIIAIGAFFWWKSPYKMGSTIMVGVVMAVVFMFMPQSWWDRMNTIQNYQEDGSAQSRMNSWWVAFRMANDSITGGGANMFTPAIFRKYAPNPDIVFDVHSIYFEIIGEQGWIGFFLFMLLAMMTWRSCSKMIKTYKNHSELKWVSDLAAMIQVGLIGYYVSGAFLGLAYYDLYYDLVAITIILAKLAQQASSLSPKDGNIAASPPSPTKRFVMPRRSHFRVNTL